MRGAVRIRMDTNTHKVDCCRGCDWDWPNKEGAGAAVDCPNKEGAAGCWVAGCPNRDGVGFVFCCCWPVVDAPKPPSWNVFDAGCWPCWFWVLLPNSEGWDEGFEPNRFVVAGVALVVGVEPKRGFDCPKSPVGCCCCCCCCWGWAPIVPVVLWPNSPVGGCCWDGFEAVKVLFAVFVPKRFVDWPPPKAEVVPAAGCCCCCCCCCCWFCCWPKAPKGLGFAVAAVAVGAGAAVDVLKKDMVILRMVASEERRVFVVAEMGV